MKPFKYLLAAMLSVTLAACGGGGSDAPMTPQAAVEALRAQAGSMATVSPTEAANQLFDYAESSFFQSFFPTHEPTQSFGPFSFRFYPSTGVYLGVVVTQDPSYVYGGVYVMGGLFGAAPTYVGPLSSFITPTDPGTVNDNKILTITVNVMGSSYSIDVGSVPAPTSQTEFCSELQDDTTFSQIFAGAGGTLTINSCSFSGNTGNIAATISITSPYVFSTSYTITYTYR